MVFGFYFALVWFLISLLIYGITWPEVLVPPFHFLFWWNLIFTSLLLFLIFVVVIGFLGVLLRIPILGLILQGIRNQVAEVGWLSFFKNRTLIWFTSQSLILIGTYQFTYGENLGNQTLFLCVTAVLLGYWIKQRFHKPMLQFSGNNRVFVYQTGVRNSGPTKDEFPSEKDVTPHSPKKSIED